MQLKNNIFGIIINKLHLDIKRSFSERKEKKADVSQIDIINFEFKLNQKSYLKIICLSDQLVIF